MRFFSGLGERGGDKRVAAFAPGIQAALQRADTLDAILPEEQRHTGASGLVWSSTIEDYLAVACERCQQEEPRPCPGQGETWPAEGSERPASKKGPPCGERRNPAQAKFCKGAGGS